MAKKDKRWKQPNKKKVAIEIRTFIDQNTVNREFSFEMVLFCHLEVEKLIVFSLRNDFKKWIFFCSTDEKVKSVTSNHLPINLFFPIWKKINRNTAKNLIQFYFHWFCRITIFFFNLWPTRRIWTTTTTQRASFSTPSKLN